jgi:hypothetical protein
MLGPPLAAVEPVLPLPLLLLLAAEFRALLLLLLKRAA